MVDVFLNEKFVGAVDDAQVFLTKIKTARRFGKVSKIINVHYDEEFNLINVNTSKGRARRPLIVVENGKSKLTDDHLKKIKNNELKWEDLEKEGIIEYLDCAEEENSYIALDETYLTPEHTHIEISPVVILGLITSLVPYSNFGSSSRLNRGSKTQKQGLGIYTANFPLRMDTDVNILHYPQTPITRSFMHDVLKDYKHPGGQNVTVAIMSYDGYNMQDGLIFNKSSIERGLARSTYFRPYIAEELRYSGGLIDEIGIPDKDIKGYRSEKDYKHLEEDGIVFAEAHLKPDDVLIGKTSPPRFLGNVDEFSISANIRRESSVAVRGDEEGIVDAVMLTENEEGNKIVEVRLRDQRIPEIGDKFASRYGQKGVIGKIIPQADMPFTAAGITPDIIFSPHSIPGRMTISHMIELLAGKTGSLAGKHIDGTTFDAVPEKELRKELLEMGFRDNGLETMYNGLTGEMFQARIFVGNMYYLRLKYMVANKLHSRAFGRIQLLTRQPIEGRAKGGGLRLGEMEKDCFVAHGASLLLKERFDSDRTIFHVCEECGMLAVFNEFQDKKFCPRCGSTVEINAIEMAYAFKLLLDEIKALCIYPKLILESKY